MGKYCCFNCIKEDYLENILTDICPTCGKQYDYPLTHYPATIVSDTNITYTVINAISRGFYAATFLCKKGKLDRNRTLLKVTPQESYEKLKKYDRTICTAEDIFAKECDEHSEISEETEHIVKIVDYFNADISFNGNIIKCFVAEMEFVDGYTLEDYLLNPSNITARNLSQITIDLFRLWGELISKKKYHNDLHEGNLMVKVYSSESRRTEALNDSIKLMVIDLNSSNEESLSKNNRMGDQRQIFNHIKKMHRLLKEKGIDIDNESDPIFRLIETLEKVSNYILPEMDRTRIPDIDEIIKIIKEDFNSNLSYEPWKKDFILTRLNDGYNAQTLHKCYIPLLIVDPNNVWLDQISISGPQLITGMRGCGKTTLLGALDFHARASWDKNQGAEHQLKRLNDDEYIGISARCSRLISDFGTKNEYSKKLIWLYTIELLGIIRHLLSIDSTKVASNYLEQIKSMLESIIGISLPNESTISVYAMEKFLSTNFDLVTNACNEDMPITVMHAFELMAQTIQSISDLWVNKKVFFLLDDASTRYLSESQIRTLFTNLLFQSPNCAFKITTELQTLELGLNSPGNVEFAREGRDYSIFDLGYEVLEKIKNSKSFLLDILNKRKEYYLKHPNMKPEEILGDTTLNDVAKTIVETAKTSRKRKEIYFGVSVLAQLCVGDIGDVVTLYDMMIERGDKFPLSPIIQTECYQTLCSRRLYQLDRRDSKLRQFALSFAEASYHLLVKSKKDYDEKMTQFEQQTDSSIKAPTHEYRQYSSLYVRITSEKREEQLEHLSKLRELVDAGVFVFTSGTPRTKTRDTNPILQFKLIFRKLYGISNYIGLSDRDRFELSGKQLEKWLDNPQKDILIKNLGAQDDDLLYTAKKETEKTTVLGRNRKTKSDISSSEQLSLFFPVAEECKHTQPFEVDRSYLKSRAKINEIAFDSGVSEDVDALIIALGFEERTYESIKRLLAKYIPQKIILVSYKEEGQSKKIKELILAESHNSTIVDVSYENINEICLLAQNENRILFDITGMTKPIIFSVIRNVLLQKHKIVIAYTEAEEYYPLEKDLVAKFDETKNLENNLRITEIMAGLLTGEQPPYKLTPLLSTDVDETRPTAILGFVSSKNQRILELLDNREFNHIELLTPEGESYRKLLAQMAAETASIIYDNTYITKVEQNNILLLLDALYDKYFSLYINQGTNLEISLTGTKLQAVATALFSTVCRLSQCWYVQPDHFIIDKFSKGVGETKVFDLRI